MPHRDDRLRDGGVAAVGRNVGDERAVDLEVVHGEALEIGERRMAGAEVVDRDVHADVAHLAQ